MAGHPAAQAPPPVPQADGWHTPFASQHPSGQLVPLHTHCEPLHRCPASQAAPHPPQFAESLVSSTHAVAPQSVCPPRQATAHPLPSHAATPSPCDGPGQFVPQAVPQLFGSPSSTHALPQRCAPGLQTKPHAVPPFVQVAVALAGALQAWHAAPTPHWVASLLAAQLAPAPAPHRWSFALQVKPHVLAAQVAVPPATAGHAEQLPQWLGDAVSSTHEPSHRLRAPHPELHAKGAAAFPVGEQYGSAPGQAFEQLPQCAGWLRVVSQPKSGFAEQMPYPGAQAPASKAHAPFAQETLPATLGRPEQSWPQPPQL